MDSLLGIYLYQKRTMSDEDFYHEPGVFGCIKKMQVCIGRNEVNRRNKSEPMELKLRANLMALSAELSGLPCSGLDYRKAKGKHRIPTWDEVLFEFFAPW